MMTAVKSRISTSSQSADEHQNGLSLQNFSCEALKGGAFSAHLVDMKTQSSIRSDHPKTNSKVIVGFPEGLQVWDLKS
jgi:hypothetical protein